MKTYTREDFVRAGVINLQQFGYVNANKTNILTDNVYSSFFCGMLRDSVNRFDPKAAEVCDALLAEIAANQREGTR